MGVSSHFKTSRKSYPLRYTQIASTKQDKLTAAKEKPELTSQTENLRRDQTSPDLSREVSNEILKKIEINGIKCQWNEIQQTASENDEQDEEISQHFWRTFTESSADYSENHSFASTLDRYPNDPYYNNYLAYQLQEYTLVDKTRYYDPSIFLIELSNIGRDPRTTLMIKNIPNKYSIQDLSLQIDNEHSNTYDFLYLPCDIKNNCNVGYGFINFVNTDVLRQFYLNFHNKKWIKFRSEKICVLTYARLQGLSSLIQHFQNSKVLNHKDKKYQPIIREFSKIENLIREQQGKGSKC